MKSKDDGIGCMYAVEKVIDVGENHKVAQNNQQPYDMAMKAMLKEDARQIIPLFVPGATLRQILDIEIIQSNLRTDRAYRIHYEHRPHIVQMEFQVGADPKMIQRLLVYHTSLWYDYGRPIISIVVYLFRCQVPTSPFQERSGSREVLTFHFQVVRMWEQDAREYRNAHLMSMYPLLPTMKHASASLLLQAIEELIHYYQDQINLLERRLLWMKIFLGRTTTVKPADKEQVMQRLRTFEQLFEQDEFVRRQRALGKIEGKAEGIAEGKIEGKIEGKAEGIAEGKAEALLSILKVRFPALYLFIETRITQFKNADALDDMIQFCVSASDEQAARAFLETKLPE